MNKKNINVPLPNEKKPTKKINVLLPNEKKPTKKNNVLLSNEKKPTKVMKKNNNIIKYIDLCCGIGGFRIALEKYGKENNIIFECVLSADIKDDALKTYNLNFNENNEKTDIMELDEISKFDMLCAGFPCQPFSSAGTKKGFDDKRGGIIFKIIDIVKKYTPEHVILENVPNLSSLNNGKDLEKICKEFENIGYNVSYKKLNSKNFGIPQNRERLFIICNKTKKINLENIELKPNAILTDIIDTTAKYTDIDEEFAKKIIDLHNITPLYGYKMQDKRGGNHNIHSWDLSLNGIISDDEKLLMTKIMTERRKKHWAEKKNIDWMDGMPLTYDEILTFYDNTKLKKMLNNLVSKKYLVLEKPKKLEGKKRVIDENGIAGYNICKGKLSFPISNILDPNDITPTLTATDSSKLAVIIDNKYLRKLTDNELKLLCGFPKSYQIPKNVNKYDLFGNMAIPTVIEGILQCIFGN